MPKKDGTPTKNELRQAELYERLARNADRLEEIQRRFERVGIEIGTQISALEISMDTAEQILDRLEGVRKTLDLDEGDRFKLRRIERILEPQPKEEQ